MLILSICFLIATLPFGYTETFSIAIYVLLGAYVIDYFVSRIYKGIKFKNGIKEWMFLSMILFYLLQLFFYPIETHLDFFHQISEDRLSFLLIGIIGIMGINKKIKLEYIAWAFVAVAMACSIFLLSFIPSKPDYTTLNIFLATIRVSYFCSHMLFNLFINTSIIFAFFLLRRYNNSLIKAFLIIAIIVFLSTISVSEGRIGIISGYVITITMLTYRLWKWHKISVLLILLPLLFFVYTMSTNHRLNINTIKNDPRLKIWEYTISEIQEHPWGMGASSAAYAMIDLLQKKFDRGELTDEFVTNAVLKRSSYGAHSHNQYLQTLLEYGPIGLFVLLAILILPIFACNNNLRIYTVQFSFLYATQFITDIFVSGIVIIEFLLSFLFLTSQQMTPNNPKL
ncbi:MAG: O-antigen ligase family protein [Paludibacteraceae bacterium]|nr:O-antigen ligase family protein [Paludibacteraceae bacterium]